MELFNAAGNTIIIYSNDRIISGLSPAFIKDPTGNVIYINYLDKVKNYCYSKGYIY